MRVAPSLLLAAALLSASGVRAQTCPAMPGAEPRLEAVPADVRIAFILSRLEAERPSALLWTRSFQIGYSALTVGQLVAVPFTSDPVGRSILIIGSASSALALLPSLLLPLTVISDAPRMAELAAGPGERCAVLAEAEAALRRGAESEAFASGILAHVGNVVVNLGIGLFIGLYYHRWPAAGITFALGVGVGELQILTQPTALVGDLRRYRTGEIEAPEPPPAVGWAPGPVRPGGAGLALAFRF
jgi:hypothetical protein